ncbi:MAG: DUF429 domain-containing protein [Desulfobaccales bacterium]
MHPELCFWALSEGNAMEHSKKTPLGFCERLNILCNRFPQAKEIISHALNNFRRCDVSKDDIHDALVAAVTAFLGFGAFPNPTEFDEKGLPMQMLHLPRQGRCPTGSI